MEFEFDIQKNFRSFQLDLRGKFEAGIVGIFGDSGSGKTTFLNCLAGFVIPDRGEIRNGERTIFSASRRINLRIEERDIGMVFQDTLLFPHLSVKENIFYGLKKSTPQHYIDEVIDLLSLYRLIDRQPQNLSGGERQRVALARALLSQPSLLLMDEPISALDLKSRRLILTYLKKIHAVLKTPIIYVSHSVTELLYLVDQVMVVRQGRSVHYGPPSGALLHNNVMEHFAVEDFENIYDLPVVKIDQAAGSARLDFEGHSLFVPYRSGRIHPRLRVAIKSKDIIVGTGPVAGLSARNVIPALIAEIVNREKDCILSVTIGQKRCLVEVTPASLQELNLKEGQKINLIIKASVVTVIDD